MIFQSTLPVWGATPPVHNVAHVLIISIHAPRVGSDGHHGYGGGLHLHFNPRSPCGERQQLLRRLRGVGLFQSTLPAWGATPVKPGEADERNISIHAPRVGSDSPYATGSTLVFVFQSTLPVWGATIPASVLVPSPDISIHAPRVGSDAECILNRRVSAISIHAPRVGSDARRTCSMCGCPQFQSTLPVWGATPGSGNPVAAARISIHAPRVGSDDLTGLVAVPLHISIHAPRVGSDTPGSKRK